MIGCGRASLARKNAFVASLLACALGVQLLLAGMALAGAAPSGEAGFSQSCTPATSSPTGQGPLVPGGHGHEHGLCCIMHSGAADLAAPSCAGLRLTAPSDLRLPASRENRVAAHAPPELEPLAPRGPPTL